MKVGYVDRSGLDNCIIQSLRLRRHDARSPFEHSVDNAKIGFHSGKGERLFDIRRHPRETGACIPVPVRALRVKQPPGLFIGDEEVRQPGGVSVREATIAVGTLLDRTRIGGLVFCMRLSL